MKKIQRQLKPNMAMLQETESIPRYELHDLYRTLASHPYKKDEFSTENDMKRQEIIGIILDILKEDLNDEESCEVCDSADSA